MGHPGIPLTHYPADAKALPEERVPAVSHRHGRRNLFSMSLDRGSGRRFCCGMAPACACSRSDWSAAVLQRCGSAATRFRWS